MNQFDLEGFLQFMAQFKLDPKQGVFIALAVFLLVVFVYLLRKRKARRIAEEKILEESSRPPASETARQRISQDLALKRGAAVAAVIPEEPSKAAVVETAGPLIPQDSVLRRHYLTHVKYMIETVTSPRPTDSTLRRHYDHLIESERDACLCDGAKMERLIGRYDEHKRKGKR